MKKIVFLVTACLVSITSMSQQSKPPLDFSVYDQWNSVSGSQLDNRGHWISYEIKPAVGDGMLYLRNWTGDSVYTFARGSSARIAPLADFLVFRIKVQHDSLRQAKLDKLKPDRMPKDSLGIYIMATGKLMKYPKLKSFKVAGENSHWMAYQLDEKPTAPNDTAKSKKKSKKKIYKGISLHLIEPATGNTKLFKEVTEYGFSKNGHWLYMVSIHEDSVNTSTVRIFNTETARSRIAFTAEGVIKKIVSDEKATQLAFLWSQDTTKQKIYSLGYWSEKKPETKILVDTLTEGLKPGWCVSEHGRIYFSENGKRLFLGLAPKPKIEADKKDSLLKEEKVFLDIWHWQDVVIQPMQLKQVSRERNKSYQAVVLLKKRKLIPLTGPDLIENIKINQKGNGDVGLSLVNQPYKLENAVNFTHFKDVYLTDVNTGNSRIIFSDVSFNPSLSPTGKYLYWWQPNDSCWYSYDVRTAVTRNLTGDLDASFVRETDDRPEAPGNYGVMGWSKEDADLFLYDKHNIWKINPAEGGGVNVTAALVKDENLRFRYLRMNPEETYITTGRKLLFSVFNTHNKQSGFYRFSLDQPVPGRLILDDCSFGRPKKAKSVDKLLWTRTTVSEYPDLWISTFDFKDARKITHANPQQSRYNWVTVELVEWKDFDGITHQGMLYKPEDFDPLKKYPMMVYFYERLSDNLHRYITPRASYSTINTTFYCSNGYLVFQPDISYKTGLPGKSAYNAIVSGVMYLSQRPYVDMKHLGLQGQSWGGYEAAYLITQTDLFAASSPGAPVSNMTSAYGGIRIASGMCRQVQYEKGQSRIGGTLWEKPELYIENSPLFFADRVHTPCLIRQNDHDGAVPFSQGVEFFVALRRLGRPAWLLNYNNDEHNLTTKLSNRKDLSVRMKQFFDHYLKGAPAPDWMIHGVKAVDKKQNETYYLQFVK